MKAAIVYKRYSGNAGLYDGHGHDDLLWRLCLRKARNSSWAGRHESGYREFQGVVYNLWAADGKTVA